MSVRTGIQKYREAEKAAKAAKTAEALSTGQISKAAKAKMAATAAAAAAKSARAQGEVPPLAQGPSESRPTQKLKSARSAKDGKESPEGKDGVQEEGLTPEDLLAEAQEKIHEEQRLTAEIQAEIEKEQRETSKLVRDDYSPINATRERLVLEYASLIKYIAQKIAARLPANIELDDLISSGVIGLMDAIDKYDATRDNKFKTYAEFRIRGAILDELRAQDWVPRSVREKAKLLERCYSKIEQSLGRQATDEEVCAELNLSQEEFHDLLNQVRSVSLLSYDDVQNFSKADKRSLHGGSEGGSKAPTPFNEVSVASLKRVVADAISDLPEKQRLVLSLYYFEDLNLKEIGRVLDVTESRVSQLHTQAIIKLKARLKLHSDDLTLLMG